MMDFWAWKQRYEEMIHEVRQDHLAKALRDSRKRRGAGPASSVAWELKRIASRLLKLFRFQRKPNRNGKTMARQCPPKGSNRVRRPDEMVRTPHVPVTPAENCLTRHEPGVSALGLTVHVTLVVLAALFGVAAGLGALIGAAAITDRPPLFLLAGLLAFCAIYSLGLLLVTRKAGASRKRRVRMLLFCAGTAAVAGAFALTALVPMGDPQLPPAPVEGQRFWELPTGSRIAFVRIPAEGDARKTPVIFLHGGPGVPDMKGDSSYFGRLSRDGYDVYVYDEVGSGRSSRLEDPRGYTLERDVADLEAVREKIGANRVILIGHSHGGAIAAAYAAAHPDHVAKMVLSSPEDPSPKAGGASMIFRLSTKKKLGVYALLLPPRPMLAYILLQVNPEVAHAFADDREMDARQDRIYNRTRPALHCHGEPPGPKLHGLGSYANQYPQSASREPHSDFLPNLAKSGTPTLVIKGRCDYLSWSSAQEYLGVLTDARLLYLDGSGHNAYQDEPGRYMANLRAFVQGRPLPGRPYEGHHMPEDYEGPP
jgi:proline iminopeptidase